MMMRRAVTTGFVLLLLLLPGRAEAIWGGIEWLDKLSGPGPFTGPSFNVPLVCLVKVADDPDRESAVVPLWGTADVGGTVARPCLQMTRHEGRRVAYVDATVSWLWSKKNELFPDRPFDDDVQVRVFSFRPGLMLKAYSWLDAGFAVGWYRFSGGAIEDGFTMFTLHPIRLRIAPFRNAARGLKFPIEAVFFPRRFDGRRFGAPDGFVERHEFRLQLGATYEY